jgi:mannose-6-phosphate isomerase-like protein (cupin superfamily)
VGEFSKGCSVVLGPEDGESYWQPLPSVGHIINKITPRNSPYDDFSMGIQVLEPGAHIRKHAHERSHEVLFCYRGNGVAEVDGIEHPMPEETMLLLGRGVQHKVTNTGSTQMRLIWLMCPAGLEDWFAAIGRPRKAGEPLPEPFERPQNIKQIQDQQRFVRPPDEE